MTKLDDLPPQSRAVLSLVLAQGRSFEEIAELLHLDPADVRTRAHAAAELLVPGEVPGAEVSQRITDYLLGEQPLSERAQTRSELGKSDEARRFASALSRELMPLARDPLPAIPEPPRRTAMRQMRPGPRLRGRRLIATLATLVAATAAVAVAVVLISDHSTNRPARASRDKGTQSKGAQTLHRLVLQPAGRDRTAFGAAAVVRQGGTLLLLLQARGLKPNHGDSYAVWLLNTPADSRLLGFVSPLVGPDGTFSSGVTLPDDAVRFRTLEVTRETRPRPTAPGQPILRTSIALS